MAANITLERWFDLSPMKITSSSFGVLKVTLFILQSTIAQCRDNQSIPNITSNSLKDNSIKSPKNSYSRILMGQSLYTLFTITLCPRGFVTKMSYSVSLRGKFPKLGMLVHTYYWVDHGSINACTIVSKIVKLPTITSGTSVSSTAFIAYALVGARPSCLAKFCVPCLGTLGDATLLLPFCIDETLPLVYGAMKGRALLHFSIFVLHGSTTQASTSHSPTISLVLSSIMGTMRNVLSSRGASLCTCN